MFVDDIYICAGHIYIAAGLRRHVARADKLIQLQTLQ